MLGYDAVMLLSLTVFLTSFLCATSSQQNIIVGVADSGVLPTM
jgi:hypothetical protein